MEDRKANMPVLGYRVLNLNMLPKEATKKILLLVPQWNAKPQSRAIKGGKEVKDQANLEKGKKGVLLHKAEFMVCRKSYNCAISFFFFMCMITCNFEMLMTHGSDGPIRNFLVVFSSSTALTAFVLLTKIPYACSQGEKNGIQGKTIGYRLLYFFTDTHLYGLVYFLAICINLTLMYCFLMIDMFAIKICVILCSFTSAFLALLTLALMHHKNHPGILILCITSLLAFSVCFVWLVTIYNNRLRTT